MTDPSNYDHELPRMTSMRGSAKPIFLVKGNNGKLLRLKNLLLFLIRSRKEIAEHFLFALMLQW